MIAIGTAFSGLQKNAARSGKADCSGTEGSVGAMVEISYIILFFVSLLITTFYARIWHKHFNVEFTLIYTLIPIVNLGYIFFAQATTLEGIIFAVQVSYIGGCFLQLLIMLNIFHMSHIELSQRVKGAMFLLSGLIFLSTLTVGKYPILYRNIQVTGEPPLTILKEYGPVHTLFYLMVMVYFLASIGAIVYALLRKREVSRHVLWLLFAPEVVCMLCFFGGRLLTDRIELIPFGYAFAQVVYLFIVRRITLYDISETAIDSLTETGAIGFISFDFHMNYLGCNATAREIFGELKTLTVDQRIPKGNPLGKLALNWVTTFRRDELKDKFHYERDDRIYLIDINYLYDGKHKRGYQLVLTDDTENQKYIALMDKYNEDLQREVEAKTHDVIKMQDNLIRSIAMMVESRDNSTGGHIIRTSDVVGLLLEEIRKDPEFREAHHITDEFCEDLIKAAPMHDIGKIAVDDDVLKKPGRFTDEEFAKMKKHAPEGARVLHEILKKTKDQTFKTIAENVAHYHHERMDGSGYPDGLKGDQIPIEARIMAIADVYDALVSKRVYKDSLSFEKANEIMMESMGKHFDKCLEKFYVAALPRIEEYYREQGES